MMALSSIAMDISINKIPAWTFGRHTKMGKLNNNNKAAPHSSYSCRVAGKFLTFANKVVCAVVAINLSSAICKPALQLSDGAQWIKKRYFDRQIQTTYFVLRL